MKYQVSNNNHYIIVSSFKVRHRERILLDMTVRGILSEKDTKSKELEAKKEPYVQSAGNIPRLRHATHGP